jgi:molybdopterin molybdotransferase
VDGFAARAEDIANAEKNQPVTLNVIADIPAGNAANISITTGQAARIMTGAPLPAGADSVVMVEDTDVNQREIVGSAAPEQVKIFKATRRGENIRWRGADFSIGQEILPSGMNLRPQDVGMLTMLGSASVPVIRKPRVALISSGDELIPIGEPLTAGKIYDSNSHMLAAFIQTAGCEVFRLGVAADREAAAQEILQRAAQTQPDVILSSAGVSVGAFDYMKSAVEKSGALNFWKVNMRPGKPLAFGMYQGIPFFGLPGNPVSSYVSFLVFVKPALEKLSGKTKNQQTRVMVKLKEDVESDGRESYLRAVVAFEDNKYVAALAGHQGSGNLFSIVQANALVMIPAGVKFCPYGSEVKAWLLE